MGPVREASTNRSDQRLVNPGIASQTALGAHLPRHAAAILALQRAAGNRAVVNLVQNSELRTRTANAIAGVESPANKASEHSIAEPPSFSTTPLPICPTPVFAHVLGRLRAGQSIHSLESPQRVNRTAEDGSARDKPNPWLQRTNPDLDPDSGYRPPATYDDRSGVETDASAGLETIGSSRLPSPTRSPQPPSVFRTAPIVYEGRQRAWDRRLFDISGEYPLARGVLDLGPVGWVDGSLSAQWRALGRANVTSVTAAVGAAELSRAAGQSGYIGTALLTGGVTGRLRIILSGGIAGHLDYLSLAALRVAEARGSLHGVGEVNLTGRFTAPIRLQYMPNSGTAFEAVPRLRVTLNTGYRVDARAHAQVARVARWDRSWHLASGRGVRQSIDISMGLNLDHAGGRFRGVNIDFSSGTPNVTDIASQLFTSSTALPGASGSAGNDDIAPASDAEGLPPAGSATPGTAPAWKGEAIGLIHNMMLSEMRRRWEVRRFGRTSLIQGRSIVSDPMTARNLSRATRQDNVASVIAVQGPTGDILAQWEGLKRFESGSTHAEKQALTGFRRWATGRSLAGHALLVAVNQSPCEDDQENCEGDLNRVHGQFGGIQYLPPAIRSSNGPYLHLFDKRRHELDAYARLLEREQPRVPAGTSPSES